MKIKTSELTGAALDWAVAKCEGRALRDAIYATDEAVAKLPLPLTMYDLEYDDGVWSVKAISVHRFGCQPGCSAPSITAFRDGQPFQATAGMFFLSLEEAELDCLASNEGGLEGYTPSTDWAQGGPIIEREQFSVYPFFTDGRIGGWSACNPHSLEYDENGAFVDGSDHAQDGPTPLIAAMRCFVASKLGDEVDVPEELL